MEEGEEGGNEGSHSGERGGCSQVHRRHVDVNVSAAARRLLLCPSACLSPICVPLTTTFITGAIEQLIYWWLEEVGKAVLLLL